MKLLFAGPTLPDARALLPATVKLHEPAAKGDVFRAVQDGATVIGLVDGYFEQVASVWQKEILFALANGVVVFGAASMGALRAAECAAFGMIGVGRIFERYSAGEFVSDADVAQIHGPPDSGYIAISEPLVNIVFTLEALLARGEISSDETEDLQAQAKAIHFKDRTWRKIVRSSRLATWRQDWILEVLKRHRINQKREDALELIQQITSYTPKPKPQLGWTFQATSHWRLMTFSSSRNHP